MIWSLQNGWYFIIWSWDFLALWGMLDAWHIVLEASQSMTYLQLDWLICILNELLSYLEIIRKVCWMCYKSVGKFVTMYFIVYLKTRLLNYFKFLIMSFYYYMKGKWCIFILKFISYFKNSMKTFYQSRHIHKIFDLHAFLLNAHRA